MVATLAEGQAWFPGIFRFGVRTCFAGSGECHETEDLVVFPVGRVEEGKQLMDTICLYHLEELTRIEAMMAQMTPAQLEEFRMIIQDAEKETSN